MNKEREYAFHQWNVHDVAHYFDVDPSEGLSTQKANFRLTKNGLNSLDKLDDVEVWKILFSQFSNLFIILLAAASIISYFIDGLLQAFFLIVVILLNVFLGFFQEYKAEKALSNLKKRFQAKCKVLRNGKILILDSKNITLGDLVILEAGDSVPADLRIIESSSLRIDESALTGESLPVEKDSSVVNIETPLADRKNMLFASTTVLSGHGRGIVTAIGKSTEFGKIAGLVSKSEDRTPLESQILYLGKALTYISVAIVLVLFVLGYYRSYQLLPLLTFIIALLIGAVPESLPTIITLSLAIGVSKMAKRKAIVRKMAVIETLGTVNIIATDKTGTLTNNKLSVAKVGYFHGQKFISEDLESNQYSPSQKVLGLFERLIICSNIDVRDNGGFIGDPLEVAVAERAKSFHEGIITKAKHVKRILEVPFDSTTRHMAVISKDLSGHRQLIVKGAPEQIITYCHLTATEKEILKKRANALSKDGLKVVAIGYKKVEKDTLGLINHLEFGALLGLVDEPSNGIKEAIEKTISAGIRPIIITGDHPETARFVAAKIGLAVKNDEIMTGRDLEKMTTEGLKAALEKVKIFARITPSDKINIVSLLEEKGYSVAVTGDGVNDAPAIKKASVGIAMGIKGTDVARDSSDIILSDDEYGTIISAVEYGRAVYDNIRNAIIFLLSGNFDELFLIGFAFIFDLPMPLLTLQILWMNLVTDSFPALALAFEEPSAKVLRQQPRSSKSISMKSSISYSIYLSIVGFFIGLVLYLWGLEHSVERARTLVFTFAVFQELLYVFSIRSPYRFWQNIKSFFVNKYLIVAIVLTTALQMALFINPFNKIFGIVSLRKDEIITLAICCLLTFLSAEIIRWLIDRKAKNDSASFSSLS